MRVTIFSLAMAAVFLAAPAQGFTDEQRTEANCVLDQLSATDQRNVTVMMLGDEVEATAAEAAVSPSLDAAIDLCTARYGWDEAHIAAGEELALTLITFDTLSYSFSEEEAARLREVMSGFSAEYAYAFTYEAQQSMDEATSKAWLSSAEKTLGEAGIAQADMARSVFYLNALADVSMASAQWDELFRK